MEKQVQKIQAAQKSLVEAAQMRAVSMLAMGIAHDLRNILTTLRLEMADPEVDCRNAVGNQVDRLYALTHSLLALSDETHTQAGPVDVNEIIDFVFGLLRGQAEVEGVNLVKRAQKETLFVHGNPRRLEHLVVNLVMNALNAVGPTGGVVTVTLTHEPPYIRMDVDDTGPGIPLEHQPRLFEPFFTTRANRTGLGLFSVRRIVDDHRGAIHILSEPGKGTKVSVWLPTNETTTLPEHSVTGTV